MQTGGVAGSQAPGAALQVGGETASAKSADGVHSQLGTVSTGPASASFFEEASITLSSLRKFKTKDSKEGKDLNKELERLKKIVPDMPGAEKMDKFLQQMQAAKDKGQLTRELIKQFSDEYSGDSTHQYLALETLAETLEGKDSELAKDIREYNAEFYEENKTDIQAGMNVTQEHYDLAEKAGLSPQQARDDKRENVFGVPDFETATEAYQYAKEGSNDYSEINDRIQIWREGLAGELLALKNPKMTSAVGSTQLLHIRKRMEVIFGLRTIIDFSQQNEQATDRMLVRAKL
ncbi:HrpJ domain-containing protein [Parendozoicomonas sp. Alg238-R29]|uniref:HrpJ domain-containing protein n=1 Tax=Parendozoicomonas sp. Alg238-R29 TaxID=2993446 RepID=UPI00248E1FDD|nr:HrpJ domain-containing protein [Parendozoicomonas sp. Alg238-R29]